MAYKTRQLRLLSLLMLTLGAPMLGFADLVTNGGFETGDFTGWTVNAPEDFTFVCLAGTVFDGSTCTTNSGSYAATMGPPVTSSLSQTLSTTLAQQYDLTFFLRNDNIGLPADNSFSASWGGTPVFSVTNAPTSGYTKEELTVTASSASTVLSFSFVNIPGGFYLDDVSVNPTQINSVPEPRSLPGIALGFALLLFRRAKVYSS